MAVIIAEGGYSGEIAEQVKKTFGYIIQVVMRTDENTTEFKPVHKRWVIERTFASLKMIEGFAEIKNS